MNSPTMFTDVTGEYGMNFDFHVRLGNVGTFIFETMQNFPSSEIKDIMIIQMNKSQSSVQILILIRECNYSIEPDVKWMCNKCLRIGGKEVAPCSLSFLS